MGTRQVGRTREAMNGFMVYISDDQRPPWVYQTEPPSAQKPYTLQDLPVTGKQVKTGCLSLIAIMAAFFGCFFGVAGIFLARRATKLEGRLVPVQATVTGKGKTQDCSTSRSRGTGERSSTSRTECSTVFSLKTTYVLEAQEITGVVSVRAREFAVFEPGDTLQVFVDAEDPRHAQMTEKASSGAIASVLRWFLIPGLMGLAYLVITGIRNTAAAKKQRTNPPPEIHTRTYREARQRTLQRTLQETHLKTPHNTTQEPVLPETPRRLDAFGLGLTGG